MVCDVTELLVDEKLALGKGVVCANDVVIIVLALVCTGLDVEDSWNADEDIIVVGIDDCPVIDDDRGDIEEVLA